jgi:hypothetical protein
VLRQERGDGVTATMRDDRRCQVCEGAQLLHLAGTRDREQARDGELALGAAIPKHDLPPLDGRAQRAFGARMPRAGLCRVAEFAPVEIGFHLEADAA